VFLSVKWNRNYYSLKIYSMGILSWLLIGLIAGAIATALHRGKDPGGWIVTIIIGILGAFVGGAIGRWVLGWEDGTGWNFRSFLLAVLGAILLLWIYRRMSGTKRVDV
jgi:uncharacterized membrane protein YeaQ/YmgE (transglycosylase-associated protein family)